MKTREAKRILRSVELGTAIYPRHVLRAVCRQLRLPGLRLHSNRTELYFPVRGPILGFASVGSWIGWIIEDVLEMCRAIGARCEFDMNDCRMIVKPTDTVESAEKRWTEILGLTIEQIQQRDAFYGEHEV